MSKKILFTELRKIKNSLPEGSTHKIAKELGLKADTVRNYFGGSNFKKGKSMGIHREQGFAGGVVELDDTIILNKAYEILHENHISV
jgi:hypothetical protein